MKEGRLRILHIVRRAEGGMRRHVLELIGRLDPDIFESLLAAPYDFIESLSEDPRWGRISEPIPLVQADIGDRIGPFGGAIMAFRLTRRIRRERIGIVHCHGYRAASLGVPAAWVAGKPSVITVHNLFPDDAPAAARFSMKVLCLLASRIIAVSPAAARSLAAIGIDPECITVIPNGVEIPADRDLIQLDVGRKDRAQVSMIDLAPESKIVFCAARLTEVKGIRYLIEAAKLLVSEMPEVHVLIAGEGPDREKLVKLAEELRAPIKFLGYRHDIQNLMKLADLVVIPSLAEGAPVALAEAMALGRPIVASDVGGISDVITNGETGLLVPAKDPGALAGAMSLALRDEELASRLGSNAREYARRELDINLMIRRTAQIYAEVAGLPDPSTTNS